MLANGHPHASRYTIAKVHYEAELVRERIAKQTITEATLIHAVIIAVLDTSKKGSGTKYLNKLLKDLRNGE